MEVLHKLRDARELESVIHNLPGFLYELRQSPNGSFRFTYLSRRVEEMFHIRVEDALADANVLLGMIHADDLHVIEDSIRHAHIDGTSCTDMRMIRPDGRMFWIEAYDTLHFPPEGGVIWTGYAQDITERKLLEQDLRLSEAKFRTLVENANDIIYTLTPEGELSYISPNWQDVLGYEVEPFIGHSYEPLIHPNDLDRTREFMRAVFTTGKKQSGVEYRIRHADGSWRWHTSNASPVLDEAGRVSAYLGIAREITERKQQEAQIHHLAHHDLLTGLPNRAMFFDRLEAAIDEASAESRKLALMFVDLDRFKPVNDRHGHAVGDQLLQAVAGRMHTILRAGDLVGRIGGDEFIVLLHDIRTEDDALTAAEKLRCHLETPFDIEGRRLQISASIGIALYPSHADNARELARRADEAMYLSKAEGRNLTTLYSPGRD